MLPKLRRDELLAEMEALRGMVERLPRGAALTARSLKAKQAAIETELRQIEAEPDTAGSAALLFGGARVHGSRAIDAEFAVRSLRSFQELVSKKAVERMRRPLNQRGPVPDRDVARLDITGTVHGSFGFLLEEHGAEAPPLFPSAVKEALAEVAKLLAGFAAENEQDFAKLLEDVDPRVLVSVREFFKALHDAEGTVRIVEGQRDESLNRSDVERAFERAEQSRIEETDLAVFGRLIGILPMARSFEFTRDDDGTTIKGKVGPQVSSEFLQRIEREAMPLGKRWRASLRMKVVERPGASPKADYILLNLDEVS